LVAAKVTNAESTWNRKAATTSLPYPILSTTHAADDDSEAETGESGATDVTQLGSGETEIGRPIGQDATADTEADAGRQDRHEACKQQPFCIGGYALVTSIAHRGTCVLIL
jgi:hypothetical protein